MIFQKWRLKVLHYLHLSTVPFFRSKKLANLSFIASGSFLAAQAHSSEDQATTFGLKATYVPCKSMVVWGKVGIRVYISLRRRIYTQLWLWKDQKHGRISQVNPLWSILKARCQVGLGLESLVTTCASLIFDRLVSLPSAWIFLST